MAVKVGIVVKYCTSYAILMSFKKLPAWFAKEAERMVVGSLFQEVKNMKSNSGLDLSAKMTNFVSVLGHRLPRQALGAKINVGGYLAL